ncbi:hypothetical protein D3C85_14860 [compost metagenome]
MSRSQLDALLEQAKLNPMSAFSAGIEYLETVTNGQVEVVDASNAFAYLMEFSATMFSNVARKDEFLNRLQYPELAMTREELYRHMSDIDYLNTFSSPSVSEILLVYEKEELLAKAVETGEAGMKKIVIPRHTKIFAGDVAFMPLYPIEIRVMPHGGVQVVFDNSKPSPMKQLETNNVEWQTVNYNVERREFIQLQVPVVQLDMKSYTAQLTASKVFNKTYAFTDQFYHCRVYHMNAAGDWVEIKTTHSDQVYDPYVPTAVLKLLDDNQLNVSVPQVYFNNGLLNRSLRIDIYNTRGALELAVQGYGADMFSVEYLDYDNDHNGKYTAPVSRLVSSYFLAGIPATGGSNALSFEKLKGRVINNALGNIELPITNIQIQTQLDRLTDAGFSCVTDIDNVTNRLYSASRELPKPEIKEISTGIGSNVIPLNKSIGQILSQADVKDNGLRITVLPSTLYKDEGGYLSIIDRETRENIKRLPSDLMVDNVVNNNYFYTPFHYVYDITDNVFKVRPYYFGSPAITRRFFVKDNGSLGVGVSANNHEFIRTEDGWVLRVMSSSTDSLKELDEEVLVAQLAFTPPGEVTRIYLNGDLVGRDPETKEWIFEFRFNSTWDVDVDDRVYLTGFEGEGVSPHPYPANMNTVFDIFYGVDVSMVDIGQETMIDEDMGKFLIDMDVVGLYHEQVTLKLGDSLNGLWARARSTVGEEQYLRYEDDIPRLHTANVPARDNETGAVVIERDANNKPQIIYINRVGDPVIENDKVIYLHRKGDVILQNGAPIVASPRSVQRQVELCLLDGVYYFINAQTDIAYRDTVPDQIVEWVNVTLKPIRNKLLENTKLWFHPKATVGLIKAIVDESVETNIQAGQHLDIKYYVTPTVLQNDALKDEIRRTTRKTITTAFKELQVTRNGLETKLKEVMGGDVLGVTLKNLGGTRNYDVISMADESSRLCIAKKLVALPNATFGVEDSIEIDFYAHSV